MGKRTAKTVKEAVSYIEEHLVRWKAYPSGSSRGDPLFEIPSAPDVS